MVCYKHCNHNRQRRFFVPLTKTLDNVAGTSICIWMKLDFPTIDCFFVDSAQFL